MLKFYNNNKSVDFSFEKVKEYLPFFDVRSISKKTTFPNLLGQNLNITYLLIFLLLIKFKLFVTGF